MNGVQWIKITTDIFDDEKIQLIESMPEGDTLIVIWFKILVLAGKQNNSGILSLGNKVYYTEEMLSTVFRRKATSVKLALSMFEEFGMIEIISFSSYARKMLFKSSPIYLQFDFESYHDFIFQVRRIINNLRQLERIAEQSEDLDNVRIFHYCVELMIEYEKKTSKQVKELVKRLNKKTR